MELNSLYPNLKVELTTQAYLEHKESTHVSPEVPENQPFHHGPLALLRQSHCPHCVHSEGRHHT